MKIPFERLSRDTEFELLARLLDLQEPVLVLELTAGECQNSESSSSVFFQHVSEICGYYKEIIQKLISLTLFNLPDNFKR